MEKITPNREEIITRRKAKQLTQKDLAQLADVSESYITRIETGSAKNLSLQTAAAIALALGCKPPEIANGVNMAIMANMLEIDTHNALGGYIEKLSDSEKARLKVSEGDRELYADAHTDLRNWIFHNKPGGTILILAVRCGWKGMEAIDQWLRNVAAEQDVETIYSAANEAGYKGRDPVFMQ
ncbi:hypothetical protein PDESU_03343 [Pontiella desulfatans]|uniref:HTH cro/C1-type domain-containing protein n=1 Tax=Pontiella desulfatans TaxID=2750659 RepID=A0A6C2U5S2_PONDE|nr:helix-turn-helix transcriptional regulator [Pontiella desulfatans]VGO14774.1 hypothetical protein PDESU_03343 [Pontiella desulfatans]